MIRAIKAANFRAFKEVEVSLTPINLILGPNNSGKSSLLSILSILSQTIRSSDPTVPLLLNGHVEELGTYDDLVYKNNIEENIVLGLVFDCERERFEMNTRSRRPKRTTFDARYEWTGEFQYRKTRKQIIQSHSILRRVDDDQSLVLLETSVAQNSRFQKLVRFLIDNDEYIGENLRGRLATEHFLPTVPSVFRLIDRRSSRADRNRRRQLYAHLDEIVDAQVGLQAALENIEFVGPLRQKAERTYLFSGEHPGSVGSWGEKAIDVLVADELSRRTTKARLSTRTSQWLKSTGLASELTIRPLTGRHYEVRVTHPTSNESQNIADVGFGVSQVLPVVIAGLSAKPGSTLILQQPELHLHPAAQFSLGDLVVEFSESGVQTLVETHSEHMILRILLLIAERKLDPKDVSLYYVHPEASQKTIVKIDINDDGTFATDWPRGFFDERLAEARRLASARLRMN